MLTHSSSLPWVIALLFISPLRFGKTAARSALQRNGVAGFKRNRLT